MRIVRGWAGTLRTWCFVTATVLMTMEVASLSGPNVCMVQQKYNITKRVKYRSPMSVRSYEWCFSIPPRCSKWSTEMRDLTKLETEERTAEVAICCPGYKMKDVSCVPICPIGKTGRACSEDCPPNKWGPNCVHECTKCLNGICSPTTGECDCLEGWQGESCQISISTTQASIALVEEILTTTKSSIQTLASIIPETTTKRPIITSSINPPTALLTTISSHATTNKPTKQTTETTKPLVSTISSTSTSMKTTKYLDNNITFESQPPKLDKNNSLPESTTSTIITFMYNRTETPKSEGMSTHFITQHASVSSTRQTPITTTNTTKFFKLATTEISSKTTTQLATDNYSSTSEATTTKKLTTAKISLSTMKFKPKEIWIKPTQKGETTFIETKLKLYETPHIKHKTVTNKNEIIVENTTPKTIIVSIIPTSVSHATFKKIALTTASYLAQKSNATAKSYKKSEDVTKSIESQTSTVMPFTIKILYPIKEKKLNVSGNRSLSQYKEETKVMPSTKKQFYTVKPSSFPSNISTSKTIFNTTIATSQTTNSMLSTTNEVSNKKLNFSTLLTIKPSTNKEGRNFTQYTTKLTSAQQPVFSTRIIPKAEILYKYITSKMEVTKPNIIPGTTKIPMTKFTQKTNPTKYNMTKTTIIANSTEAPTEDETFHILTEPEHITAVMTDKEKEHTSVDLISVISIAGGVMMAIITVAIIIVMVERCKRPRYDETRKMNEIRMQSMIDNEEEPPPYVRSIFHTPLPEPPIEKCHYQPITTLDRSLKQFMRPVIVQTISPVMLENFRGILECHYDHLPRRNHDFEVPLRSSASPSINYDDGLRHQRPLSIAETIEALKCEAKFDVIDTSAEPLYAEIPSWRPPSAHAVEVVNLNGEAVTEL